MSGIAGLLVLATFIGRNRAEESQKQVISNYFPDSLYNLNRVNANKWDVYNRSDEESTYIYIGEGLGYNGKVRVLIQTDLDKHIYNVIPVMHHETPSFFKKLEKNGLTIHCIKLVILMSRQLIITHLNNSQILYRQNSI